MPRRAIAASSATRDAMRRGRTGATAPSVTLCPSRNADVAIAMSLGVNRSSLAEARSVVATVTKLSITHPFHAALPNPTRSNPMKYRTSLTAYASLSFLAVAACSGDTTGVSSPSTALGGSTTAVGGTNTLASGGSDTTSLSQGGGAGGGTGGGSGVGGTTSSGGTSAPLGGTTGAGGCPPQELHPTTWPETSPRRTVGFGRR
jgi:hypothetical protein